MLWSTTFTRHTAMLACVWHGRARMHAALTRRVCQVQLAIGSGATRQQTNKPPCAARHPRLACNPLQAQQAPAAGMPHIQRTTSHAAGLRPSPGTASTRCCCTTQQLRAPTLSSNQLRPHPYQPCLKPTALAQAGTMVKHVLSKTPVVNRGPCDLGSALCAAMCTVMA